MSTVTRQQVGYFGGTFDPIHQGHLILAEQAREQGKLDEVWFLPTATPPHKADQRIARFEQRVEMIALAIAGNPAFRIEEIEKERPGFNYTADTLEILVQRNPNCDFSLLIGSDSLADLPGWHEPQRIVANARLLVMLRAHTTALSPEELRSKLHLAPETPLHIDWITAPPVIDIASRDLRQRTATGRSIRYLVPRAVECYIQEKNLYR